MTAKILSSRTTEDESTLEQLREILFLVFDTAKIEDEPGDDMEKVMHQLNNASVAVCVSHEIMRENFENAVVDLAIAAVRLELSARHIKTSINAFQELMSPPVDEQVFQRTLELLRREGEATVEFESSLDNPLELETNVTFNETKLSNALREALAYYNTEIIQGYTIP